MVPGFVALGLGTLDLARHLERSERAPLSVRRMLLAAGVTTIGAGLARCSSRSCPSRLLGDSDADLADELHGAFSLVTFLLWIATPLVSANSASNTDAVYSRRALALAAGTFLAWAVTGALVTRRSSRWSGLAQRAMAIAALSWFPLVAS
jgi:hypothetical protein